MNLTIEKIAATVIEHEKLIKIKDPFVMGVYTFIMMEIDKGQHAVKSIIDTAIKHFEIEEHKVKKTIEIIVDELELLNINK